MCDEKWQGLEGGGQRKDTVKRGLLLRGDGISFR